MTRVVASIEARMGSSRLPGKMMMMLGGIPVLEHLVTRMMMCERLDGLIIATSDQLGDDAIAAWANSHGVQCFRGSEDDVMARVLGAHENMRSDVVVELCGDTPFLDPRIVDSAIEEWNRRDVDLVTTARNRCFPDGQDVEVFSLKALKYFADKHHEPEAREHVSWPLYQSDAWRIHDLSALEPWHRPSLRLVLDTPSDAQFLGHLAAACGVKYGPTFNLDNLLSVFDGSSELQTLHAQSLEAAA